MLEVVENKSESIHTILSTPNTRTVQTTPLFN